MSATTVTSAVRVMTRSSDESDPEEGGENGEMGEERSQRYKILQLAQKSQNCLALVNKSTTQLVAQTTLSRAVKPTINRELKTFRLHCSLTAKWGASEVSYQRYNVPQRHLETSHI